MRLLELLRFNQDGLIPAVIQDRLSGKVLMVAYMNKEAIEKTIETGRTHLWSRSRKKLWQKGETSGNYQSVKEIYIDCDEDTLLLKVEQIGVPCHTGEATCFYRAYKDNDLVKVIPYGGILEKVHAVILDRKNSPKEGSYVSSLMAKGKDRILKKIGEEAGELIIGSKNEKRDEIIYEIADLWFHTLVVMGYHNVSLDDIYKEFEKRFGKSGKRGEEESG